MADNISSIIVFGVILWTTLFLLARKMFKKRSFVFCGRLVSIIHSLQVFFLASYSVQDWTNPFYPLASTASPLQMKIVALNIAYYIYDLERYQFDLKNIRIDMVLHHMISLVGLIACLAYQMCGVELMAGLWINEIPSPIHHWRELLKDLGCKDTNLNIVVDILFVNSYTLSKMICGTYLTFFILTGKHPIIFKAAGLAIQLLSYFWFYKIAIGFTRKHVFKHTRTSTRKIHSN